MKILVNFADEIKKYLVFTLKKCIMENNEKNKCGKLDSDVLKELYGYYQDYQNCPGGDSFGSPQRCAEYDTSRSLWKHFESACSSYGISTDEFLNYTRTETNPDLGFNLQGL